MFFASLAVFAILLLLIQYLHFGKLLGFTLLNNFQEKSIISESADKGFEIGLISSEKMGGFLRVVYQLNDISQNSQNIDVFCLLKNAENNISKSSQNVVLEKNRAMRYICYLDVPNEFSGKFNLGIYASNGQVFNKLEKEIYVLPSKTTGFVTLNITKESYSNILVFLLCVLFLFFVIRFIYSHHKKITSEIKSKHWDKGLIKLDLP